jgi:hypothetical protein
MNYEFFLNEMKLKPLIFLLFLTFDSLFCKYIIGFNAGSSVPIEKNWIYNIPGYYAGIFIDYQKSPWYFFEINADACVNPIRKDIRQFWSYRTDGSYFYTMNVYPSFFLSVKNPLFGNISHSLGFGAGFTYYYESIVYKPIFQWGDYTYEEDYTKYSWLCQFKLKNRYEFENFHISADLGWNVFNKYVYKKNYFISLGLGYFFD